MGRTKIERLIVTLHNPAESCKGTEYQQAEVIESFSPGAHISVNRGLYAHHGLYVGDGMVIHYTGTPVNMSNAEVKLETLENFAGSSECGVFREYSELKTASGVEAVKRAVSRLGEREYNLPTNNCEHFARWCRSDAPLTAAQKLTLRSNMKKLKLTCLSN